MKDDGKRKIINGHVAENPYYYYRAGLLHCKYTVDECVQLSPSESTRLKVALTSDCVHKQEILEKEFSFQISCLNKTIYDGIIKVDEMANAKREYYARKEAEKEVCDGFKN